MTSTLTQNNTASLTITSPTITSQTIASQTAAPRRNRTFACQWDVVALLSLLLSSGAYSLYAITQMTGF